MRTTQTMDQPRKVEGKTKYTTPKKKKVSDLAARLRALATTK